MSRDLWCGESLNRSATASDSPVVLICATCRSRVVFTAGGWVHHSTESTCGALSIAWPSPVDLEEGDVADPAV